MIYSFPICTSFLWSSFILSKTMLCYLVYTLISYICMLVGIRWLPVHYRIMFKILLLSYQCFYTLAPSYLTELLTIYKPGRNLRSDKKHCFVIPPVLTKTYGERTFAHAAPIMWNNLPDSLRSINSMEHFKSAVKTYLFELSLWYHEPIQCLLLLTSFFLTAHRDMPCKVLCAL